MCNFLLFRQVEKDGLTQLDRTIYCLRTILRGKLNEKEFSCLCYANLSYVILIPSGQGKHQFVHLLMLQINDLLQAMTEIYQA